MSKRLRKDYVKAVKGYITAFEKKQDVSIEFDLGNLNYFSVSNYVVSLSNIMYDVDLNVPIGYIFEYSEFELENFQTKNMMNYPTWLRIYKDIKIDYSLI